MCLHTFKVASLDQSFYVGTNLQPDTTLPFQLALSWNSQDNQVFFLALLANKSPWKCYTTQEARSQGALLN